VRWSRFPPHRGEIADLTRGAGKNCLRDHRIALAQHAVGSQLAVGDGRADAQASSRTLFDDAEWQARDVDQTLRRLHAELHQVDQVGAAAEVGGASPVVEQRGHGGRGLVGTLVLELSQRAVSEIAGTMFMYAPQRQMLPLMRSRISSSVSSVPSAARSAVTAPRPAGLVFGQHARRRADLTGSAVAALERVVLDEGGLERVQLIAVGQALDRHDRRILMRDGQREAGVSRACRQAGWCTRRTVRGRSPSWRRSGRAAHAGHRAKWRERRRRACASRR